MARIPSRSNDWGFPRWRGYGSSSEATTVRLCDRHGCDAPGKCPAPKSPNSPDRWYFCENHAAEYNRGWNYFEGLSAEEAAQREAAESDTAKGYAHASHYAWGGSGDGSRSRDEMRALEALAKENHPDVRPGDADAAVRFQTVQAAYEVLRSSEERREWRPS